ncbi:hypothetical protein I553_9064 [Mycobacterium xenopi 4042]|uniref:Uncharacterized protein n=1 Tax=Mycobacterium xenopi 4042 TaxID=1299334 RepID=X8AQ37_MYCXE|nr:hypothetical protein I553_9064 [Mycobacterium xenopi 4042]
MTFHSLVAISVRLLLRIGCDRVLKSVKPQRTTVADVL